MMSNGHEKSLWREIDRLLAVMSILGISLLASVYILVGSTTPVEGSTESVIRALILDVIANLIPTFLLFVGAYALFRRIQALKSEQETEEIASRVALKVIQIIGEIAAQSATVANTSQGAAAEIDQDKELERRISGEFPITSKSFDDASDPQKIIVRFTNRGNNIIRVQKLKYSETGLGLPASALLTSYRIEGAGRYIIIPVDPATVEVLPGKNLVVELCLAQKWERDTINGWAGKWGYLKPEVIYDSKTVELFYSI